MRYTIGMRFVIPEKAVTHFHLRPGDVVADFGAGTGYFSVHLAKAVMPDGRVYACEIQKNLVEALGQAARSANLSNIIPVWADIEAHEGTKLPPASIDVVIVVNTLFQVEDREGVVREAARILRRGGKVIVIDWTESWGGTGPQPSDVVTQASTEVLFNAAGFTTETTFDAGDHHYGITFRL